MGFWGLMQILVNLLLFAACGLLWVRLHRPAKDDPRLSKGLQLLQSKIAVLEDLSDRTEHQVAQLTAILETKCREIQEKIIAADKQISLIDQSAQKSLEVAKIFQDRIPHSEILERQNTIKYVKAARMAHRGASIEEIAQQVELSRAEIEFIAKVNRDRLQFSEEDLPGWARPDVARPDTARPGGSELESSDSQEAGLKFSLPRERFESPVLTAAAAPQAPAPTSAQGFVEIDLSGASSERAPVRESQGIRAQTSSGKSVTVKPVSFPRIETPRS